VQGGVRAILNYAPTRVVLPQGVELKHINPILFLQSMTYHLMRSPDRAGRPADARREMPA